MCQLLPFEKVTKEPQSQLDTFDDGLAVAAELGVLDGGLEAVDDLQEIAKQTFVRESDGIALLPLQALLEVFTFGDCPEIAVEIGRTLPEAAGDDLYFIGMGNERCHL